MTRFISLILALCMALSLVSCGSANTTDDGTLRIACTTYPVYLMAHAVAQDVENVTVSLVIDQQVSCLHNYTLTISDMKAVEAADYIAINGAGMEEFLGDVLENREILDCSGGIELLYNEEEQEDDPHFWLSPANAALMAQNLADGLSHIDSAHEELYQANLDGIRTELTAFQQEQAARLEGLPHRELITFHDGFSYFAEAFDLEIAAAVEEEEGSEASARRIRELVEVVDEYHLPAVFTEYNGSDSAARALSGERGLAIYPLSMGMSRDLVPEELSGLDAYEWVISGNIDTLLEAYS